MLAPLALVIHYGVVAREPAYLERKFRDVYRGYCSRLQPWLQRYSAVFKPETPSAAVTQVTAPECLCELSQSDAVPRAYNLR
jgi:hypothetical protein